MQSSEKRPGEPYARSVERVLAELEVEVDHGLDETEVAARRERFGSNRLPQAKRRGAWQRFLAQFHNVLIYVLIGAGAVTLVLGHLLDSAVIFGVVFINALIGFLQEGKAEQALDAIRDMLSPRAQVLRAGSRREIPAEDIVPGDILVLGAGDKVPADARLIRVRGLRVDEAALTGESLPVEKGVEPLAAEAPLGDRSCMAYSGTLVVNGQGTAVVVATGEQTEIGHISAMLHDVQELTTPLLRQVAVFGRWLTWVILAVAALAFAFGFGLRDYSAGEMFLSAVGLAVAAIPEGLPAIMTITLAIGVRRMALRNAIIRRLPSVEALGSVSVICSDKTGTLTRNEMTVQKVVNAQAEYAVSGVGYRPVGEFSRLAGQGDRESLSAGDELALRELSVAAVLCSDALIEHHGGKWVLNGDPTEGALVALAGKAGIEQQVREQIARDDVIPFESEHRFMATLHHEHAYDHRIYLKGAPERLLELCEAQRTAQGACEPLDLSYWERCMDAVAGEGMRLLAVAVREGHESMSALNLDDIERGGFTLLAVLGLSDPPRDEAVAAVANCRAAGIDVKMITGDHAATAAAIGRQLGLGEAVQSITGAEIEKLDDLALQDLVARTQIFARASPEHKLRLVTAMQAQGQVVAMTGDGVNDAPALKRAEVGIAMGNKGTEAAKEASEMVLADDNFASIAAAVEEGRTVYDNLKKSIGFILPTNVGQAGIVFFAILLGLTMPITPAQILWVNMITAVTLALALAFEQPEPDVMQRPPRKADEPLLGRFLIWRACFVGVLLIGGGMAFFLWEVGRGASLEVARTAAVNALLIGEVFYLLTMRSFSRTAFSHEGLTGNRYVLVAIIMLLICQVFFTYASFMQTLFGTAALDMAAWLRILVFGVIVMFCVEFEKMLLRRARARARARHPAA